MTNVDRINNEKNPIKMNLYLFKKFLIPIILSL
jgi:hypothetical protein